MKRFLYIIILFFLGFNCFSQDLITSKELNRTYNILVGDTSLGTVFLIKENNLNYWVTAKHVLGKVQNNQAVTVKILQDTIWRKLTGKVLLHSNPLVDIALIQPNDTSSVDAISLDQTFFFFGDEGFFLGFPFGLKTSDRSGINKGFPVPLIKKCVLSGNRFDNGVVTWLLDGNNNPGFSGGPVFFKNRKNPKDQRLYLLGVISAYINQWDQLVTPFGLLDYKENSGIIITIGAKHIKEILIQNGKTK